MSAAINVWRRYATGAREELALLFVGVLFIIAPFVGSIFVLTFLMQVLAFYLLALSLDMLWGRLGYLSFGQAAFFGVGGYVSVLALTNYGARVGTVVGLAGAVVLPAVLAMVIGGIAFWRGLRGPLFVILTLGLSYIFSRAGMAWYPVTGGFNGIAGFPPFELPWFSGFVSLWDPKSLYWCIFAITTIVVVLLNRTYHSEFGLVIDAIRNDEGKVQQLGYNVNVYKTLVFVFSGIIAGLGGALYSQTIGFINPDFGGVLLSTSAIVWVALGGRRTLVGPLIGVLLVEGIKLFASDGLGEAWLLTLGVLFMLAVLYIPNGVASVGSRLTLGQDR